jgi:hypothetical protein
MMLNPRNQRHQKRPRIGQRSHTTLQGDQKIRIRINSRRTRIKTRQKTELRQQNLLQERLPKIKKRIRKMKMTNHLLVRIKIKLHPKTLLKNLLRKIHQLRSQLKQLRRKMPKAFGRDWASQRQRLMLQRIRAGNLANRKTIKTRTRKTLTRTALIRRGAPISQRRNPRLETKGTKLLQTHLMLEFHQKDLQVMMTEMIVQPTRTMTETWRRRQRLLQLERERNQRSTSHSTMWMFLVSKLCGSSSRHDAAIPGISRPSPG